MKDLKEFLIPFAGLKEGIYTFNYKINKKFFTYFQYEDFLDANIDIQLVFEKKSTMIELLFTAKGTIKVSCDVTNEPFHQPITSTFPLLVKFGNEYNNDNDEVLILPHNEFQINVAHYIYEMLVLSLPIKRVHPGVEDGTLDSEVLQKLKEYTIDNKTNSEGTIDPRWNKLKDIVIDKKS